MSSNFRLVFILEFGYHTVGDYIDTMKTTFDLNFDLNQAVKQYGYTKNIEVKEDILKNFFLVTCNL